LELVGRDAAIVDVGCRSGILLTWLHQRGYRTLWGCDLKTPIPAFKRAIAYGKVSTVIHGVDMYARNRYRMRRARAEATGFPESYFSAVTAMSVIEHRVLTILFFREAARLLHANGLLFLSTDYWSAPMTTAAGDHVFGPADVRRLTTEAAHAGFRLLDEPDLEVGAPVILEGGLRYTFLTLAFELSTSQPSPAIEAVGAGAGGG
jgi:2-polyprenyl-3-methyl-5-hydroxy-6-metoxy-1,4-benzoquinol methylase